MTIYQVAKAAGVSIGTASRILNGGNKEVWASAAERANRIRKIAKDLGYRPSWRARTLAAKKTWTIGLIQTPHFPLCTGPYEAMLLALSNALSRANYHLTFVRMEGDDDQHPLLAQGLDGVIAYHVVPDGVAVALQKARCPVVVLNALTSMPFPSVLADDRMGAELAADHLHQLGHRRAMMLSWVAKPPYDLLPHYSTARRREAFEQRFAGLGDGATSVAIEEVEDQPMERVIEHIKRRGTTAIVVDTSDQALPLLYELWRAKIRVPHDVSVICWNNLPWTRYSIPPLTVVETPMEQLGREAAAQLLQQIEAPEQIDRAALEKVLPERLIVRESTASPPA